MNPETESNQPPISCHSSLPYLTSDIDGIGGIIKKIPADFFVEEIPKYEFSGTGTHVYVFIQKKNMPTQDVIEFIARQLGKKPSEIGYAGRKDARAITRQWLSIEHIKPEDLAKIETKNLKILDSTCHTNKLKVGHLKGNKFSIRLRNLNLPAAEAVEPAQKIIETLSAKGVPNYFGPQRFGYRGDSHLLGAAAVKRNTREFFDVLLGRPELNPQDEFINARQLYEQGEHEAALYKWNSAFGEHRKALKALLHFGGDTDRAFNKFNRNLLRLLVSAWQSELFNRVLAKRMPRIDTILDGDMAYKHINGASFEVEDAAVEQPRCDAFEISPTGPLVGMRMTHLTGPAGEIENGVLNEVHLTEDDFKRLKNIGGVGGRRPMRFKPENTKITAAADEHGDYLELHFDLPSGCYATVLLREITK